MNSSTKVIPIDCDAQRSVVVHGIVVPMVFRVLRGYAKGQTAHLLSVQPCHVGGFLSNSSTFWDMLPGVAVEVMLDSGTKQIYRMHRNRDGLVSQWLEGLFDPIALTIANAHNEDLARVGAA